MEIRCLGIDFENKVYWCWDNRVLQFDFLKISELIFLIPLDRKGKYDYVHAKNYKI